MSTRASAAGLAQAMKELSAQWERTRVHWNDAKAADFEREYLADLPTQVTRAASAIEEIDALLRKVRDDCE